MAERSLCSAIFVGIALLVSPGSAFAQDSTDNQPWLPGPTRLASLHETLAQLDPAELATALARGRASVEDCVVAKTSMTCAELTWRTDAGDVAAARWEHRSGTNTWSFVHVTADDGFVLFAQRWTASSDDSRATDATIDTPGRPRLRVGRADLEMHDPARPGVRLHQLIWWQVHESTRSRRLLSADRAVFDGRWRITDARSGAFIGPRLGEVDTEKPLPQSGFLPPSFAHVGGDVTEVEAVAIRATSALGTALAGYVRSTFSRWYGLGMGIVGRPTPSRRGLAFDDARPLATVGAVWQPGARAAVAAEGDAVFGRPLRHAAVSLETPGYEQAWRTQRIRRGGYFREWSHTRVGVALHAESHVLRASGFGSRTYRGVDVGRSGGGRVGFGTEQSISDHATLGLEVAHSTVGTADTDNHRSTIRSDVMWEFGRTDKAWVRAGGLGMLRARLVPTEVGFGAGTSGSVYAASDAGLSFTGRFEKSHHTIRPSVFVISELVDFRKSAAEAASEGSDDPAGTAVASERALPWHSAGFRVAQTIAGRAVLVDMPLEVFAATFGRPESFVDVLGASAGIAVSYPFASGDEWSASTHMVCERACQNVAWDAGTRLSVGQWHLGYEVARQNLLAQRIADLQATRDTWSRALAAEAPPSSLRISQAAHVGWSSHRFRLDVGAVTDLDGWGASVEPRVSFDELGWSVGLTGYVNDFDGEWGLLVGLQPH